ncbi:hypothetical protein [Polymorphospora sp. A560]|uniref:hypothetical protein n=1 Tax=Polymorphospora sp. A560 TaxID=3040203 RepID=UPI003892770D
MEAAFARLFAEHRALAEHLWQRHAVSESAAGGRSRKRAIPPGRISAGRPGRPRMSIIKVFGRSPSGPRQAAAWVVVLLAVAALAWLLLGASYALASPVWWLIAIVPCCVLLMWPFSLYRLSEERTGPSWVAFGFAFVLMVTAAAVPAVRYMRAVGVPVTATVHDISCFSKSRNSSVMFPGFGGVGLVDSSGFSLVEERRVEEIPTRVSS